MCALRSANSFLRETTVTTDLVGGCPWGLQLKLAKTILILLPWDSATIFYDPYSFHFAYRIKYFLN